MAKFTCEVDTEAETIVLKRDGVEIDAESFSIGCYPSCCYMSGEESTSCYLSFSTEDEDGLTVTNSIYIDAEYNEDSADASKKKKAKMEKSSYSIANAVGKLVEQAKASSKLEKALSNKKA